MRRIGQFTARSMHRSTATRPATGRPATRGRVDGDLAAGRFWLYARALLLYATGRILSSVEINND
uniref:Uncharacterized protein n=1 Tax=Oryza sativa subsp. japonica TaxID=39947 RepID=Q6ZIH9_ORYSJ|nr:hypothetical protein [Oryza sativa Japonica Group]